MCSKKEKAYPHQFYERLICSTTVNNYKPSNGWNNEL